MTAKDDTVECIEDPVNRGNSTANIQTNQLANTASESSRLLIPNSRSWTSRWVSMSQDDRDSIIGASALLPLLAKHQVASLIQGIPPDPSPHEATCWLDDYAIVGSRLGRDVDIGVLAMPCTPQELADWAGSVRVDLPAAFTAMLRKENAVATTLPPRCNTEAMRRSRHGGQHTAARDINIQTHARKLVDDFVAQGKPFKKADILAMLSGEFHVGEARMSVIVSKADINWSEKKAEAAAAPRSSR